MRATGYILIAIAVGLMAFVGVNYLMFDSRGVAPGEEVAVSKAYFWVLLPALGALIAGIYMMTTQARGYDHTYNPAIQEANWNA